MPVSNFFIPKLLNYFRSLNCYNDDDIDMIRYSLQVILWEIERMMIIFLIFWLIGYPLSCLKTLLVWMSIRVWAGGYHSKTAIRCFFFTFTFFFLSIIVLPRIPINNFAFIVLSAFSLFITLLAAPMRSIEKEALQKKDKDLQKKITAFLITLIWLALIYFNPDTSYAWPCFWSIVIQNSQLLLEYLRRKEAAKCQKKALSL